MTLMQTKQTKRGRKPSLSRDKIIEKTLALLNSSNPENFSIRRLAQELEVTPAAIYVYFSGQDELLKTAAEEVASRVELDKIPTDAPWRETLAAWAYAVRQNHRTFPHATLMLKMSQHIPNAWFRVITPVWNVFAACECDEAKQIECTQSFIRGVAGLVLIEIQHDDSINVKAPREASKEAGNTDNANQTLAFDFISKLGTSDIDKLFEQSLDLLLDGIELQLFKTN